MVATSPRSFRRREVLAGAAMACAPTLAHAEGGARVRPGDAGWPTADAWSSLGAHVGGRLAPVAAPDLEPAQARRLLKNPYYIRDQAALTQSSGWIDAWRSAPSAYVVRARSAADVSAAVRFAAAHRLRLVVKGGGHSYLGGSNAPDSLLVWTRDMEAVDLHDAFVPQGSAAASTPAVSVGAGCIWGHVYDAVTTRAGRYVQGGGCLTVGVAGLVQGGGFGSFSKRFGTGAAGLLEAEVVTADGRVRVVNAAQDPDLYWALKGGGGGTFGVVTRMTLKTHTLPETFGVVNWKVRATSDDAYRALLARFIDVYAERLFNPHWGEQARAGRGNVFEVNMLFQGLDAAQARDAWRPVFDFLSARPHDYVMAGPPIVAVLPPRAVWDYGALNAAFPGAVKADDRSGARRGDFYWADNEGEASAFWHGYESLWMPAALLAPESRARLARAWFDASRVWSTTFHFNKGLAGAPRETIAAARDTAMSPQVLDAFALAIVAMDGDPAYPGFDPPDLAQARGHQAAIRSAANILREAAPGAGSYLSECSYHLQDWRRACWGEHAPRLEAVKLRYDPNDLFVVHHGVGSHRWSPDGFTRQA